MSLVFVDTETTGLDSDRHDVWEIAAIWALPGKVDVTKEKVWRVRPDLSVADPMGLSISGYYRRTQDETSFEDPAEVARDLAVLLDGKHLVGAVPDFDARFLTRFLRRNAQAPTWHYHLIDVEAMAVGYLSAQGTRFKAPWKSEALSEALGLKVPEGEERHTAMADARWAKVIYEKCMGFEVVG